MEESVGIIITAMIFGAIIGLLVAFLMILIDKKKTKNKLLAYVAEDTEDETLKSEEVDRSNKEEVPLEAKPSADGLPPTITFKDGEERQVI